jgi:hypothetical protein
MVIAKAFPLYPSIPHARHSQPELFLEIKETLDAFLSETHIPAFIIGPVLSVQYYRSKI